MRSWLRILKFSRIYSPFYGRLIPIFKCSKRNDKSGVIYLSEPFFVHWKLLIIPSLWVRGKDATIKQTKTLQSDEADRKKFDTTSRVICAGMIVGGNCYRQRGMEEMSSVYVRLT